METTSMGKPIAGAAMSLLIPGAGLALSRWDSQKAAPVFAFAMVGYALSVGIAILLDQKGAEPALLALPLAINIAAAAYTHDILAKEERDAKRAIP